MTFKVNYLKNTLVIYIKNALSLLNEKTYFKKIIHFLKLLQ